MNLRRCEGLGGVSIDASTMLRSPYGARYVDLLRGFQERRAPELVSAAVELGRLFSADGVSCEEVAAAHFDGLAALGEETGVIAAQTLRDAAPLFAGLMRGHTQAEAKRRAAAFEAPDGSLGSSQSWFRSLWAAPIAMFLLGPDGSCLYINPALADLLDIEPADCLGANWLELFAAGERDALLAGLQTSQKQGREFATELRLTRAAGDEEWIALRTAPLLAASGAEYLRVGTVERITERKHAERVLRESETKFRTLAETVPAAIFIYRGSQYLYVNSMMERLTGFTRDEILNKPIWEIVHPEFRELARRRSQERQAGRPTPNRYELKLLHRSGEQIWIDFSASLISFEGGPAVMGAALDITARKMAEAEAQTRQSELLHVARVSTMGQMASEIAHELNQPLAAIVNYASGCQRRMHADDAAPAADLAPVINEMRREAERAGQIIRRMRTFVRKQPTHQELSDINALVREAVHLAQAGSAEWPASVDYALDEALPPVFVDRVQIIQVLVNLVRNALEALQALEPAARRLRVSTASTDNGAVEVRVSDNGPGLAPEAAAQLFDAFFTTKSEGLGLGLSISRAIVEAHAGRMGVASAPQGGAAFWFTLPTLKQEDAS